MLRFLHTEYGLIANHSEKLRPLTDWQEASFKLKGFDEIPPSLISIPFCPGKQLDLLTFSQIFVFALEGAKMLQ
jgi:hypothetical protein